MEAAQAKLTARLGGATIDEPARRHAGAGARACSSSATPTRSAEKVQELLDAGLDGIVFNMPDAHDLDAVALAGERPLRHLRRALTGSSRSLRG